MGLGRSGHMEHRRRRLDLQGFQALSRLRRGLGDLPDGAVRAQQLRELDAPQTVRHVAPSVVAGVLDGALQQQRQHRDRHMRVDAVRRPVEDRAAPAGRTRQGRRSALKPVGERRIFDVKVRR